MLRPEYLLVIFVIQSFIVQGQSDSLLKKIWELEQIEPLKVTMGSIGEEFMEVDLRHDSLIVFMGGGKKDSVAYKVIGDELAIFDKNGKQLGPQVLWKIEEVTRDSFVLMFFDSVGNAELLRLRYRPK